MIDMTIDNIAHYEQSAFKSSIDTAKAAASQIWPDQGCKLYEKVFIVGYTGEAFEKEVTSAQETSDFLDELVVKAKAAYDDD